MRRLACFAVIVILVAASALLAYLSCSYRSKYIEERSINRDMIVRTEGGGTIDKYISVYVGRDPVDSKVKYWFGTLSRPGSVEDAKAFLRAETEEYRNPRDARSSLRGISIEYSYRSRFDEYFGEICALVKLCQEPGIGIWQVVLVERN